MQPALSRRAHGQVSLRNVPRLVSQCRERGPLAKSALDEEELKLFDAMLQRMFALAEAANEARLLCSHKGSGAASCQPLGW